MTDETSVDGLETNGVDSAVQQTSEQVAPSDNTNYQVEAQEKLISQSDVNKIVTAQKQKSYDRGLAAARQSQVQENYRPEQQSVHSGGVESAPGMNKSQIDEMIKSGVAESMQQQKLQAEQNHWQGVANGMVKKFEESANEARDNIEGFNDTMSRIDLVKVAPGLFAAASSLDNPAEVLHHLVANRAIDIKSLDNLSNDAPQLAAAELKKISDRLKQNKNAKNLPNAPDPIGQIDTNVRDGIGGAEPQSIADFKNSDLCRG